MRENSGIKRFGPINGAFAISAEGAETARITNFDRAALGVLSPIWPEISAEDAEV
jgi:hypothetical protein